MLYLIATPIGNLSDFTFRAVETLKSCDYILCEDTRHSRPLLQHYSIDKPLKSFHRFNEKEALDQVIDDLREGKTIALISDAGTPLIADPGHELVMRCRQEKIALSALPGPCAALLALVLSGFPALPFQFIGFLPKKESELQTTLSHLFLYLGTTICYETPHRIEKTLEAIHLLAPTRPLSIARELTKFYEESLFGTASELLLHFSKHPPRGEMVLLISPAEPLPSFEHLSVQEHVALLQSEYGLSEKEAIKMAAQLRDVPKRDIYKIIKTNQ